MSSSVDGSAGLGLLDGGVHLIPHFARLAMCICTAGSSWSISSRLMNVAMVSNAYKLELVEHKRMFVVCRSGLVLYGRGRGLWLSLDEIPTYLGRCSVKSLAGGIEDGV